MQGESLTGVQIPLPPLMTLQIRHTQKEFSAGGIVYKTENNKIFWLVTQHSLHKGWSFPKGLIGDKIDNESKEETAQREVEEEGGIKAKIVLKEPFSTNYFYTYQGQKIQKTVYFFLMEYQNGDIKNHDFEVSEARWLTTNEVRKILTFPADIQVFAKAVIALNKVRQVSVAQLG